MNPLPFLVLASLALAACRNDAAATLPQAVSMTEDALGHYCQMALAEHPGPKAQVHLAGVPAPLFFSQVRDAIAYQRMPEQSHSIRAIYVSDMAVAPSWDQPGIDNWIDASTAHYVVGAEIIGGMGAPEMVPFGSLGDAQAFVARHGGEIMGLALIPDALILAPVEFILDEAGNFLPPDAARVEM
jgi:copper chaperone NosL